jgi:excisionase family DNA binding protein
VKTQQTHTTGPALAARHLFKINEAAEMLALSIPTMRRLIKRGEIRVNRKTRHVLIPRSEIERFAAA